MKYKNIINYRKGQDLDIGEKGGVIKSLCYDILWDLLTAESKHHNIWQNLEPEELSELTNREDIHQLINDNIDNYTLGNYTFWGMLSLLTFDQLAENGEVLTYGSIIDQVKNKYINLYENLVDYIIKYYKLENITD